MSILELYNELGGNVSEVARYLKIDRSKARRLMDKEKPRVKRVLIGSDMHEKPGIYNPVSDLFYKAIQYYHPQEVVIAGDWPDIESLLEISGHKNKGDRALEGLRLSDEIKQVKDIAKKHIKPFTNKLVVMEGNHENRIEKFISKYPQAAEGFLEYNIAIDDISDEVVMGYSDQDDNVHMVCKNLGVIHGHTSAKNVGEVMLKMYSTSMAYGHDHRIAMLSKTHRDNMTGEVQVRAAFGLGCLTHEKPKYMKGRVADWGNGFLIADVYEDGTFTPHQIVIINNRLTFGGMVHTLNGSYKITSY